MVNRSGGGGGGTRMACLSSRKEEHVGLTFTEEMIDTAAAGTRKRADRHRHKVEVRVPNTVFTATPPSLH